MTNETNDDDNNNTTANSLNENKNVWTVTIVPDGLPIYLEFNSKISQRNKNWLRAAGAERRRYG